ncbi:MAG: hypothetical protein J6X33_00575 [Clostridiales bacterium]|nr:hypothetical protein [Clostridiales bacterium]
MKVKTVNREDSNNATGIIDDIGIFFSASARATSRYLKNVPSKVKNFFVRKINERRNRPPRKDISKVYVLVGYTTRKLVDDKFNAERHMIILRRGLLIIIFVLLMFITLSRVLNVVKFDDMKQIFGISGWSEVVNNDPFNTRTTANTVPVETSETSASGM